MPGGNFFRRRLLVGPVEQIERSSGHLEDSADSGLEPGFFRIDSPRGHLSAATSGSSGYEGSEHAESRASGQHAANDVLVSDQSRMVTSPEGREFIKRHEGPGPSAYSDPRGVSNNRLWSQVDAIGHCGPATQCKIIRRRSRGAFDARH
jgi:hypothetical protein